MKKFIVKERRPDGFYKNPYRRGGKGLRWTKWKTVSTHTDLYEATRAAIVTVGVHCRAVFYDGNQISDGNKLRSDWQPGSPFSKSQETCK